MNDKQMNDKQMNDKQIVCFIGDTAFDYPPMEEVKEQNVIWGTPKHYEIKDKGDAVNETDR